MKLYMNLNLRPKKQNYYLTSLNYVVTIVFSASCIKQANYFFQKKFHVSCIYYLLSQRFLYFMTVKLPNVRNNLFEESNRQLDRIVSKTRAFNELFWEQKRRVKKLFDGKRIWETRGQQYSSSYFCYHVCCCFSYQYFPFLEGFLLFHW